MDDFIRYFHLLGAAVWIGGMVTVAALVPALRKSGAAAETVRAVARRFGMVAWVGMGLAVVTGIAQVLRLSVPTRGNTTLMIKLLLVAVAVSVTMAHQLLARSLPPAARGAVEGVMLLLGLAILWFAIQL